MVEGLFPRGEHAHLLKDLHRIEPRSGEALLIDDSEYLRVNFLVHAQGSGKRLGIVGWVAQEAV